MVARRHSVRVRLAPVLEKSEAGREFADVDIAAAKIAQIVAMRLLLDIGDPVLWQDRPEPMAEAVDQGGAHAARGVAAGKMMVLIRSLTKYALTPVSKKIDGAFLQTVRS